MKKIQSLKYSQLSETWSELSLNTNDCDPNPILSNSVIFCVFDDGILRQFDFFGHSEEIGCPSSKVSFFNGCLYYVENGKLNNPGYPISCNGEFLIDKDIFVCSDFLDKNVISLYQNGKMVYKSQLIPKIAKMERFQKNLLIQTDNSIIILDEKLNEIKEMPIAFLREVQTYDDDDDDVYVVSQHPNEAANLFLYQHFQLKKDIPLKGNCKSLHITDHNVLCSTDEGLVCYDRSLEERWTMEPAECVTPFIDKTEHVIIGRDKNITIYEIETEVMTWKADISHKICGEIAISDRCFVVCSYEGGGIHYF